jgi:hypothetical protein
MSNVNVMVISINGNKLTEFTLPPETAKEQMVDVAQYWASVLVEEEFRLIFGGEQK